LVVDGDIVDLNRILLPPDTPIIDKRFKDRHVGYSQGVALMEVLASPEQVQAFVAAHPRDYWVFGEDRSRSIRRRDALPAHWVNAGDGMLERFQGRARPGEFYVFQLGLYSMQQDVGPVRLRFEDLSGQRRRIAAQRLRCLSLGGTDYLGRSFTKDLVVKKGRVQALWIGVDVPADAKGTYTGSIVVAPEGDKPTKVRLTLDVEGEPVEDHGDGESWRLSRLRWLDSTIGLDDNHVVAPYEPVRRQRRTLSILGRQVELSNDGLPARIRSFFSAGNTAIVDVPTEILARPMELVIQTDAGPVSFVPDEFVFTDEKKGRVQWRTKSHAKGLDLTIEGTMEFDGALSLRCELHATKRTVVDDVRLDTALTPDASVYFMGLGHKGGRRPALVDWKWSRLCQDAFWMGGVNAGLKLQFKGENYRSPLVNIYYHFHPINIPESWGNDGKGGIRIRSDAGSETRIVAYSGARTLAAGQRLVFQVDGMISPMKLINTDAHWKHRYFHRYLDPTPYTKSPQRLATAGVNVWNIHHCSDPLPLLNYPCWDRSFPVLKHCVELAHEHDLLVKIYYTTREITHLLPEHWAFFSLNGEIIFPGPGLEARSVTNPNGPHPWLAEHLREDFIPGWREKLPERYQRMLSLALITTPDSRLDNFYLEGLDYIVRNTDIDGLYIDGTSLGRKSVQQARRIFEHHKKRFLFDFHEGYGGMHHDKWGRGNPLLRFCDILPYFDRIWLGEGYSYNDTPPDFWLIEMSGIPFGVMGEMLQNGGNPWLGMVYGMTQRMGTSGNPRNIWKVWDEFGMQGSRMLGYWDPDCPVKTDSRDVLATAYVKSGKTLIALGNWGTEDTSVRLKLNWQALGLDPAKATLFAPAIDGFQTSAVFRPGDLIPVSSKRGRLIIVDETPPETLRARVQARVQAERPYIGSWEFTFDGVICQRRFNPDHTAELFVNGKRQAAWNNFTWRLEDRLLIVDLPDGSTEKHHLDDQGWLVLPFGLGTARKIR
jgi:hypothetical protein